MEQEYKYFAFISYSSKDTSWGKRIHRKLEYYRMPSTLCRERGWTKRTPMSPIFFAPYEIQPGGLSDELKGRLRSSRHLIVICSPNSAQSEWVGKEIEFFHSLERTKQIHFFIVDGEPHSGNPDTECFNPIVDTLGLPEILGANIHEKVYRWPWLNKERAYVQLISKLLGVEFDTIWQRHRRLLVQRTIAWAVGIIAVLAALLGVWMTNHLVDVKVSLNEASVHNPNLPPLKDAVVTLQLDNETKMDTIYSLEEIAYFTNIPSKVIGQDVRITFSCNNFLSTDTIITLSKNNTISIRRDSHPYGDIVFSLWKEETESRFPNVKLTINGHPVTSDADGFIRFTMPLEEQDTFYIIGSPLPLVNDTLQMPTTESMVLKVR